MIWTETEIIKVLAKRTDSRLYPFRLTNAFVYAWECDYWTLDAHGNTREFEVKCSRSDFLIDSKKAKHSNTDGANYFYYVCPEGMIRGEEVKPGYGLIWVAENGMEIIKKPRRLNHNVFTNYKQLAEKYYWKWHGLWHEKYIAKEIDWATYKSGHEIDLFNETEPTPRTTSGNNNVNK